MVGEIKMVLMTKEQLRIANSGGLFQETGQNGWVGTKVRKGEMLGLVTQDLNGALRVLTVRFDDGKEEVIRMNNLGPDFEDNSAYEWLSNGKWYRF